MRSQKILRDFVEDTLLEFPPPADGLVLVEDIQLGLCGMQSNIWKMTEQTRRNTGKDTAAQRDTLGQRLESWYLLLLRLPFRPSDHMSFGQDQYMAMRFYYGFEDHAVNGWQVAVLARPKGLFFDAIMLYHLLALELYADIRIFRQHAHDLSSSDLLTIFGQDYLQDRLRREAVTREWTNTRYARRALCHCTSAFVTYNNLPEGEKKMVDPIAYVALSVGALLMWNYCTFSNHYCKFCPPETSMNVVLDNVPMVELTKWRENLDDDAHQNEIEMWIKIGGCRPALAGIQLCYCNRDGLVGKFRACLPQGWNLFGVK